MLYHLPPRCFGDTTVPPRPDGSSLDRVENEEDLRIYLAWLADYLVSADLPLPPRQSAFATMTDGWAPEKAVFEIADHYGYAVGEIDSLEVYFDSGGVWETWEQDARTAWQDLPEDVRALGSYEEFSLGPTRYAQLREEWEESREVMAAAHHADIPYRALLARILRRVSDHGERLRLLRIYFDTFAANAAK